MPGTWSAGQAGRETLRRLVARKGLRKVVSLPELASELSGELAANPEKPASVVAQQRWRAAGARKQRALAHVCGQRLHLVYRHGVDRCHRQPVIPPSSGMIEPVT